jgi:maleate cis-trans isomerase
VHGWERGHELQAGIEQRVGVPFEMMGLSVPAGAVALGHNRVALATTYYGTEWVGRYTGFAQEAGLEVVGSQSFVDQGHYETDEAAFAASFDGFAPSFVADSIAAVAAEFPDAQAIVVPGIPARLLDVVPGLEQRIGRPVVSYYAIWWRCLARLGIKPDASGHGALLDSL